MRDSFGKGLSINRFEYDFGEVALKISMGGWSKESKQNERNFHVNYFLDFELLLFKISFLTLPYG